MASRQRQPERQEEPEKAPAKAPDITLSFPGSGAKIEVSIWRNDVEKDGKTFPVFTTRLQRSYYVEGQGGKGHFKNTQSLRAADLLVAAYALQAAYGWIEEQKATDAF